MFPKAPPPDLDNDIETKAVAFQTQPLWLWRNEHRASIRASLSATTISQTD
jgi:hypothetical protein